MEKTLEEFIEPSGHISTDGQPGSINDGISISLNLTNALYSTVKSNDGTVKISVNCSHCLTKSTEFIMNSHIQIDTSNNRCQNPYVDLSNSEGQKLVYDQEISQTKTAMNLLSVDVEDKNGGNTSFEQAENANCAKTRNGDEGSFLKGATGNKSADIMIDEEPPKQMLTIKSTDISEDNSFFEYLYWKIIG